MRGTHLQTTNSKSKKSLPKHSIFDVLYGFIPLTECEQKIINSPFFQRLRWIKQLGFSNYIFPGAEHNRFAHAIGVMHSMHQMIKALGIGVSDYDLFHSKSKSKEATLHKSLRIAALLHDIGTFPFSHAIEYAYIRHGNDNRRRQKPGKELPNSHEHLGSFIIKNTFYKGGISEILESYGLDIQMISKIIKGESPHLIANQLMHSDLDADRMDYLIRDSHYTGIKYGQFDREYILSNLETFSIGKSQLGFGIRESAIHAVEDFLISRFSWYSQVIKNQGSAKFDIMSSHIAQAFLQKDLIYQFHDLLEMIHNKDERFFWWNDIYFMNRCQEIRFNRLIKDSRIEELTEMLMYRHAPKTIRLPLFNHKILGTHNQSASFERDQIIKKITSITNRLQSTLSKKGTGKEWILVDIPQKDVTFTANFKSLIKKRKSDQLFAERDPIKVINKDGSFELLIEKENSLMKILSGYTNFVPSLYANDSAVALLKKEKLI